MTENSNNTTSTTFNTLTPAEQSAIYYSDAHKAARGCRPGERALARFLSKSPQEQEEAIDDLYEE